MNIVSLLFGIAFLVIAGFFWTDKAIPWLEKVEAGNKRKMNLPKLGKNLSFVFLLIGCIFLVAGFSSAFKEHVFRWAMIVWFILVAIDVYVIEKTKFFLDGKKSSRK